MIHAEHTQRRKWYVLVVRQFKIERFLFDYKTKIGEKNANRVSGVLIGSANTQRTHMISYWVLKHVHLTSSFYLVCRIS